MTTPCEICGNPVKGRRERFCSVACRGAARKSAIIAQCEQCGGEMRVYKHLIGHKRFCSRSCHVNSMTLVSPLRQCEHCGRDFATARMPNKNGQRTGNLSKQRFCGARCRNLARPAFRPYIDRHGYRVLRKSRGADAPQVYEHRVVMEKIIGRPLRSEETVHHRDGNRSNNEPENLELWSSRHGKGQRIEDKIAFAKSLLEDYGYVVTETDSAIVNLLSKAKEAA